MTTSPDSFGARSSLTVGDRTYGINRLDALEGFDLEHLPYSLKVLLENLVRNEDGVNIRPGDIEALAGWDAQAEPDAEIAFSPARILMQDFTGVPAVVDLAVMRDAMADVGGDPARINPRIPVDLVIDHSIIADVVSRPDAFKRNAEFEFERNGERYRFLRWGQGAFDDFRVVPPNTGICHQVNLEYLSQVVFVNGDGAAYPDTLVGTDSHTPMVNGLGVLGWGVGGIEAEAAMLGQPISMLIPRVIGFRLVGEMAEGSTATDLVLTVAQLLRQHGVVGKFVEFYGPGVAAVPLANRATIGNMSPEYGSTVTIFPVDDETLRYLRFTGRSDEQVALVEAYTKEQGLWHSADSPEPRFSETLELDLSTVKPSLAGPTRPQDRVPLDRSKEIYRTALAKFLPEPGPGADNGNGRPLPMNVRNGSPEDASADSFPASDPPAASEGMTGTGDPDPEPQPFGGDGGQALEPASRGTAVAVTLEDGTTFSLDHGAVVIAAITSCTNTSNPSVMLAAGLLAKNAVERGLEAKPWVKRSLAPGSKVVVEYYDRAGLTPYLEKLGYDLVGFGCTTCIGNSGPLLPGISEAVQEHDLVVCSVLSGNRNFEGRINPDCRMNFLASPPLVVTYALAGTLDIDLYHEPLGTGHDGEPVFMRDIWPSEAEIQAAVADAVESDMFRRTYAAVFEGDERWRSISVSESERYPWDERSTYIRKPPFFEGMTPEPEPLTDIRDARVLAVLGDSVTTDHISPAGVIRRDGPAGKWLQEHGVEPRDFNSYGARRGNHEVMMRGTFANIRLRNQLVPGVEGGVTIHFPDEAQTTIYDAAMQYQAEGVPLVVLAGKEYGSGSSRDWAAKGAALLGVRAVIAETFERIHRSNLVGMGVLPLQYRDGANAASLGLTGRETFTIEGIADAGDELPPTLTVKADDVTFEVDVRIDTPKEQEYFRHGGILHYVIRQTRR
jgi:aconitate hydratase